MHSKQSAKNNRGVPIGSKRHSANSHSQVASHSAPSKPRTSGFSEIVDVARHSVQRRPTGIDTQRGAPPTTFILLGLTFVVILGVLAWRWCLTRPIISDSSLEPSSTVSIPLSDIQVTLDETGEIADIDLVIELDQSSLVRQLALTSDTQGWHWRLIQGKLSAYWRSGYSSKRKASAAAMLFAKHLDPYWRDIVISEISRQSRKDLMSRSSQRHLLSTLQRQFDGVSGLKEEIVLGVFLKGIEIYNLERITYRHLFIPNPNIHTIKSFPHLFSLCTESRV